MRRYFLTKPANTGRGTLNAGDEITDLLPNERWALCQLGVAVCVPEKDAAVTKAGILADAEAEAAAKAAKEAADLAAVLAANAEPASPEDDTPPADNTNSSQGDG
jgi:hypothetical protein